MKKVIIRQLFLQILKQEERRFDSITQASNELQIHIVSISSVCRKLYSSSKSKKDGCKYTFKFLA